MITLLLFLLAAFGITYAVTESVILARPRLWIAQRGLMAQIFIYCAYCVGFWAGVLLQLVRVEQATLEQLLLEPVFGGCIVMGAIALLRAVTPDPFLPGAWEREQPIIEAIRRGTRGSPPGERPGGTARGAPRPRGVAESE